MADEKVIDLDRLSRFHSNLKSNGLPMNDWQANKKYKVGYVVIYNGNQYRCTVEHTSTSTFDSTKFDLVGGSGSGVPIGTIISFMGLIAPSDYLICDGTAYNIADYQALADHINTQFGSYNFFGGDGTATFAVPDLRGEFLRGTGTNSHTNQGNGANVGVHQDGTQHVNFRSDSYNSYITSDTNFSIEVTKHDSIQPTTSTRYSRELTIKNTVSQTDNARSWYTSRPTNTSVLYCIKYK